MHIWRAIDGNYDNLGVVPLKRATIGNYKPEIE